MDINRLGEGRQRGSIASETYHCFYEEKHV